MTSIRQIEANRRNSLKSTGPKTETGKQASRCNAVRHGLTAETVIGALEDAEDYKAFEAAITANYDAQSAVERELVLRLASLLWRLRRATTIETGLFEIQADHLSEFRKRRQISAASQEIVYALFNASLDPNAPLRRAGLTETFSNVNYQPNVPPSMVCTRCSTISLANFANTSKAPFVRITMPGSLLNLPPSSVSENPAACCW
jgi:hypothetical protein